MKDFRIEKQNHYKLSMISDNGGEFYHVNFILCKNFIDIAKQQSKQMLNKLFSVPGFRKDKIPLDVLEKKLGGKKETYGNVCVALANKKLLELSPNKIIHTYDYDIEFHENEWHIIFKTFMEEPILVKDSDIDMKFKLVLTDVEDYINFRLHHFADANPILKIKDGIAEENDMVEIAIKAYMDNEPFNDGSHEATNIRLIKNSIKPRELAECLIGSKPGDNFAINVTNIDDIPVAFKHQFINKKLFTINVIVNRVFSCEETSIDDELAITAGYNNLEDWKSNLRETAVKIRDARELSDKKQIILNHLTSNIVCQEYPDNWAEAKLLEYQNSNHVVYKDKTSAIKSLKESAKQLTILKYIGIYLNINYGDSDKPSYLRDDRKYADKVLQHLMENVARFEYVDNRPEDNDRKDRENREHGEGSVAQI